MHASLSPLRRKSALKKSVRGRLESLESTSSNRSLRIAEEFNTIKTLPEVEREDAESTRRGSWGEAPPMDEFWDGEEKMFWEKELTTEELHRRLMVRSLRSCLLFNLGYAFNGIVANLKKRKDPPEPGAQTHEADGEDEYTKAVPKFKSPQDEERYLRTEIMELFKESTDRLSEEDAAQDSVAFMEMYKETLRGKAGEVENAGLQRVEKVVDEICDVEEFRCQVGIFTEETIRRRNSSNPTPEDVLQRAHEAALRIAQKDGRHLPNEHFDFAQSANYNFESGGDGTEPPILRMTVYPDIDSQMVEAEAAAQRVKRRVQAFETFRTNLDRACADAILEILSLQNAKLVPQRRGSIPIEQVHSESVRRESLSVRRSSISSSGSSTAIAETATAVPTRRLSATSSNPNRRSSITTPSGQGGNATENGAQPGNPQQAPNGPGPVQNSSPPRRSSILALSTVETLLHMEEKLSSPRPDRIELSQPEALLKLALAGLLALILAAVRLICTRPRSSTNQYADVEVDRAYYRAIPILIPIMIIVALQVFFASPTRSSTPSYPDYYSG